MYLSGNWVYVNFHLIFFENDRKNKAVKTPNGSFDTLELTVSHVISMILLYKIYVNKIRLVPISKRSSILNVSDTKNNHNKYIISGVGGQGL